MVLIKKPASVRSLTDCNRFHKGATELESRGRQLTEGAVYVSTLPCISLPVFSFTKGCQDIWVAPKSHQGSPSIPFFN